MESNSRMDLSFISSSIKSFFVVVSGLFSYPRTLVWTFPLIVVVTVAMASISLFGSLMDSEGRFQHLCARIWACVVLLVSGVRVRVDGLDHLSAGSPYVLCVNHQSYMDIPVLLKALPVPIRFAAKKELFRVPFLGWHLGRGGHVPVDRMNPAAAVRVLDHSVDSIRRGIAVVIFPEGRTSQDGEIGSFKGGAFVIAERSGAEIIPVTIQGTRSVLAPRSYKVKAGNVKVTIGERLASNDMSLDHMAAQVRDTIVSVFYSGNESNVEES